MERPCANARADDLWASQYDAPGRTAAVPQNHKQKSPVARVFLREKYIY